MASNLETLLRRIRDGQSSADEVAAARSLVRSDDRIPQDLRGLVLLEEAELASDAAGLLSVLGSDDLGELLAEAILAESTVSPLDVHGQERDAGWQWIAQLLFDGLRRAARDVEVTEPVLRRLPRLHSWVWGPAIAEAVRAEASTVEVAPRVMEALGHPESTSGLVAAAVRELAGTVDVADAVLAEVGVVGRLPVSQAVLTEAGTVDLADEVLRQVGVGAPVLADPTRLEAPANNARYWLAAAVGIAAAFLAMVVGVEPSEPTVVSDLEFAGIDEVFYEDLSFGEGAPPAVVDTFGGDGVAILWFDEEA